MKKLTKVLALLMACLMLVSLFAGCGKKEETPAKTEEPAPAPSVEETPAPETPENDFSDAGTGETEAVVDAPSFKLGFIHSSFSDQLGVMYQKYAQYAADQLGCEIIFQEAADDDTRTSAQQNLIEMGCQGLIMTTCSEAILQRCIDAGVYYVQVGNSIADPALKEFADNTEYYIGSVLVDNYQVGRNMVDALYEQGCRKLAFIEFTPGKVTTMDDRARGMADAAAEYSDLEVVTVYNGMPASFAEGAEQLLAAGTMAYVAGGAFPNAEIGVAMLYNHLSGYPIWEDTEDVTRPLIELQSVEDYENYMKYFEGDLPCYTGDELKTIVAIYNSDVTMEDVRALAADSSVESVVERHAGLIG